MDEAEFYQLLKMSALDALRLALGKSAMEILCYKFKLDELILDAKAFHTTLYSLFSDGSVVIEKIIIKEIYKRIGLQYQYDTAFNFENALSDARRQALGRDEIHV